MKYLTIVVVILIIGLTVRFTGLRDPVMSFVSIEMLSYTDELVVAPDALLLGERVLIKGGGSAEKIDRVSFESKDLDRWMSNSQTQALLVQKDGKVLYEKYQDGSEEGLAVNGLSMAKTLIALLVGIAIEDGKIQSETDSVTVYLPEIKLNDDDEVSIKDLLQQISGMRDQGDHVFAMLAGESLEQRLSEIEFGEDKAFSYSNVNYHLLTLILKKVYDKNLSELLSLKIWQPLGLGDAYVIENTGFCCVFATARSWLKIGELFLNQGEFEGQRIISAEWLGKMKNEITVPEFFMVQGTSRSLDNAYAYHIFTGLEDYPDYYWSEGMGLQMLMMNPQDNTIIVRLGDIPHGFHFDSNRWDKTLVSGLLDIVEDSNFGQELVLINK